MCYTVVPSRWSCERYRVGGDRRSLDLAVLNVNIDTAQKSASFPSTSQVTHARRAVQIAIQR
jgi:hypothetical protein